MTDFASIVREANACLTDKGDVDEIIRWLTGYSQKALEKQLGNETDFETSLTAAADPVIPSATGTNARTRCQDRRDRRLNGGAPQDKNPETYDVSHKNYAMFYGHQIALDKFRAAEGVNWTVASPPNGLGLEGFTGKVRFGGDELLRDPDGKPARISLEDFAYAVYEELEAGRYIRQRFNTARIVD